MLSHAHQDNCAHTWCGDYSRAGFISFSSSLITGAGTIQGREEFKEIRYLAVYIMSITVKQHFYVREKFMRISQNRPLVKLMQILFMQSSALCIVTYGVIKIYAVQIYTTSA